MFSPVILPNNNKEIMNNKKILVIVDAGHGVETPGKRSPDGRHREYSWCRRVARLIAVGLSAYGIDAALAVPEETDVSLRERCRSVARLAGGRNAVLVSVHNNASGDGSSWRDACGWSVFVAPNASVGSKRLAACLFEEARKAGILGNRATPPCGYWTASLAICRDTPCPAVLTENMFQDNRGDVAFLSSLKGIDTIVAVHVEAIRKYFGI